MNTHANNTVTAAEARAVKHADAICFDHFADGTAFLRAISRPNGDYESETTVSIAISPGLSRINNYGSGSGPYVCFDMIMSAQYDHAWRTIARQIRTGSVLALVWTRDNNSPITREAGIVVDMLDLTVQNGKTISNYRVSTRVSRDNSARMVRVA